MCQAGDEDTGMNKKSPQSQEVPSLEYQGKKKKR